MTYALYTLLCWVLLGLVPVVALALVVTTAGYGRHGRGGWGPVVPARLGWLVMEAVSPIAFVWFFITNRPSLAGLLLAAMWCGHYGYRALIYPLRARMAGQTMPVLVAAMAVVFNAVNGSINGWGIAHAWHLSNAWLLEPQLWVGVVVFAFGLWLNLDSDAVLRRLRAPGERGYKIPRGGAHRLVAAPNYLGEIIEWTGFAIAASTLAGWVFALFTAANLAPRAYSHLCWYRRTFPDYPKARKALIPYLW